MNEKRTERTKREHYCDPCEWVNVLCVSNKRFNACARSAHRSKCKRIGINNHLNNSGNSATDCAGVKHARASLYSFVILIFLLLPGIFRIFRFSKNSSATSECLPFNNKRRTEDERVYHIESSASEQTENLLREKVIIFSFSISSPTLFWWYLLFASNVNSVDVCSKCMFQDN